MLAMQVCMVHKFLRRRSAVGAEGYIHSPLAPPARCITLARNSVIIIISYVGLNILLTY